MAFAQGTRIACTEPSHHGHKLVAVIGHIGDFAVYEGPAEWGTDYIATNGDKIGEDEARERFPELKDYNYRR